MAGHFVLWDLLGFGPLPLRVFLQNYRLARIPNESGFYTILRRQGGFKMITDLPTSNVGWKDGNFWVGGNWDPESSLSDSRPIARAYSNAIGEASPQTDFYSSFFDFCYLIIDSIFFLFFSGLCRR